MFRQHPLTVLPIISHALSLLSMFTGEINTTFNYFHMSNRKQKQKTLIAMRTKKAKSNEFPCGSEGEGEGL